jgi:uncharacterized Zn finger protein
MKNTKVIIYKRCKCSILKTQIEVIKNEDGTSTAKCLNCGITKTSKKK